MLLALPDEDLDGISEALLSDGSDQLMEIVFRLNLGVPINDVCRSSLTRAIELGWVDNSGRALTPYGQLAADPIREYKFWLARGRTVHAEALYPILAAREYRGKRVLEPGSGFGANLMSLNLAGAESIGLEPVPVYRQFAKIFAEREGLPEPLIYDGVAEKMPFDDDEFDFVVVYSAHQYMDIGPAILEMARVLRPGGQLRIMGTVFGTFALGTLKEAVAGMKWGAIKGFSLTMINTLAYEILGKRIYVPRGDFSTVAPIYPRFSFISRSIERAGLLPRHDLARRVGLGTAIFGDKPPVNFN